MHQNTATRVAIVGGARTPFAKAGTVFRKRSALDLSVHSVNGLLEKQKLDPESGDELVFGIVVVNARVPHLAREVVFSSREGARQAAVEHRRELGQRLHARIRPDEEIATPRSRLQ